MWNSSYCKANYDCNYCHTLVIPVSVSLQVTVHLHNAGATLLTGVGFLDSSYWCSWFGRAGRELPWEPQGCLWSQTQTHTHTHTHTENTLNTAAHWEVLTVPLFITSTLCLSSPLSVSGACLCFPTRHHQLSTRGTRFMKWVSTHWSLSLHERMSLLSGCIRPAVYQGRGGRGGHMYFMICCSKHKLHTGELFPTSCTGDGHMEAQVRSQ